jgi:hypothetical protein
MKLISTFSFILGIISIFVIGCTKNESTAQISSELNESKQSINIASSWIDLAGQMLICESKDGYKILKADNQNTGLLTAAIHDNTNFKGNMIAISSYELNKNELKIIRDLYYGILLVNGKLSNNYHEMELDSYREAIANKTAQVLKFNGEEYIITPIKPYANQKPTFEKLTLKSTNIVDSYIVTYHFYDDFDEKKARILRDVVCKKAITKNVDNNSDNLKAINTPEKCYQYISNNLDPRLKSDKLILDGIREDCKKPKQAVCLKSKTIEARKVLTNDEPISVATIEEWTQECAQE